MCIAIVSACMLVMQTREGVRGEYEQFSAMCTCVLVYFCACVHNCDHTRAFNIHANRGHSQWMRAGLVCHRLA